MNAAHQLARKFETQIKAIISEKYSIALEDLYLLLEDEDGVYIAAAEPHTLCAMVVGRESGHLYLVTAKIDEVSNGLSDYKSDIVS